MPAGGPVPIYITAKTPEDLKTDACDPLPPSTPDLKQFVVLVKRGGCVIARKIENLESKGAVRILYFVICKILLMILVLITTRHCQSFPQTQIISQVVQLVF